MLKRGLKVWLPLAVIAACAAGFAIWLAKPANVVVVHPRFGPAVQAVFATGTVEPTVMTPIAPRIGARLAKLEKDEGDLVNKGDVLAVLENTDLRASVAQLAAQEQFARSDYLRDAALVKGGIIARQTYDRAKSAWLAAREAVTVARAQESYMTLRAPGDGRIIRRDGEIGQYLPVNQPLFWLSCLSPLRISADVDEEDIALVRQGQKALVRADAFPGQTFRGHVQSTTPKGDSVARSYRVRIALDSATPLQIGMTVETNILTKERMKTLLVPTQALTSGAVWTVRERRLSLHRVVTGIEGQTQTEVLRGLAPDDLVVLAPDATLRAGERVSPTLSSQ